MRPAFAAIGLAAACMHPANIDPPAPAGLADRFELIAFFDETSGSEVPLHRWAVPVLAVAGHDRFAPYAETARAVLDTLDGLTPMPVRFARAGEDPSLAVLVGTWPEIDAFRATIPDHARGRARRFDCATQMNGLAQSEPTAIVFGFVFIDAGLPPDQIRRCLAQEITQALGLPNDIDDPDGTVFSTNSRRETLSASDENIVRILYDPRLRPGMTRAEAMPIVRQIAAELEAEQAQIK